MNSIFLQTDRIYATWEEVHTDLSRLASKEKLRNLLHEIYPEDSKARVINCSGQFWPFSHEMEKGDWVVIPSRQKPSITRRSVSYSARCIRFRPIKDSWYRGARLGE
jgi:predicted Mrr-cat superfamily restriction endonuclease